ncbi:thioredoxin domain-containing protein [Kangiella sediminilitoris]|uniref:Thioredoxin n=1 Tax=Kangiella sediminilitoris TaxID=1144748 RepID=A0A1B3B7U2_9GAMM|nr:thioredoxin domain-containing protein [Kangiella sediminilitoris]AOE48865.1 thioredoxin [Kangiella sediminilitoris]
MRNTLSQASSPYLLQHQDNPVHWQQWTDEVIAIAKEQDKPILLSIGYSSCHWCHVMAHESFEDDSVAAVMNEHFINIKVDREERPDIDKTFQLAHQLLNRQAGGWPLTAVLDPQTLIPFFSGTYFPKEAKFGLPAFTDLLNRIKQVFDDKRDDIVEQNDRLNEAIKTIAKGASHSDDEISSQATNFLSATADRADKKFGGMEGAPKFPQAAIWEAMLKLIPSNSFSSEQSDEAAEILRETLTGFTRYGLFDHLGGGFFRYCVDERWEIPHFEKMLYDNGQLLSLISQAGHYFADGDLMQSVELTLLWLKEQMLSPEGGYYSALDADSEDQQGRSREGAYYCWSDGDFDVLGNEEQDFAKAYYGLDKPANFEGDWHLQTKNHWRQVAEDRGFHEKQAPILMESARQQLKMIRDKRPLPFRDDKILTSWNALVMQGLLQAKRAGVRTDIDESIQSIKGFFRNCVWRGNELFACYKNGAAYQEGFLDDYAYLAKALVLSLSDNFIQADWVWLKQLCDELWQQFADQNQGGFYFTSDNHETVIARHKTWSDDAMPNSACQALEAVWVVAEMTGDTKRLEFVEKSLKQAATEAKQSPLQHSSVIHLIEQWQQGLEMWVLRGESAEMVSWQRYLKTGLNPYRYVFAIEAGVNDKLLEVKFPAADVMVGYCCREHQCFPAVRDFESLKALSSGDED